MITKKRGSRLFFVFYQIIDPPSTSIFCSALTSISSGEIPSFTAIAAATPAARTKKRITTLFLIDYIFRLFVLMCFEIYYTANPSNFQ